MKEKFVITQPVNDAPIATAAVSVVDVQKVAPATAQNKITTSKSINFKIILQ